MATAKRIPERMCVACRQLKSKTELLRVVSTPNGIVVDATGKINGRGVYLCKCKQCIDRAKKNKSFAKNYGFSIDSVIDQLENAIEQ